jgi:hypothetical protein
MANSPFRSDRDIEPEASEKVHPSGPNITLSVKNGVCIYRAWSGILLAGKLLLRLARSVRGVRRVDDKLPIEGGK